MWGFLSSLLVGLLPAAIQGSAIGYGAYGLMDWSGENVQQGHDIREESKKQREFEYMMQQERFQMQNLDYYRDLNKIGLVESFDLAQNQTDAMMQSQRLSARAEELTFQSQQEDTERNLYLQEKAFTGTTGKSFSELLGSEQNVNKLSFILSELEKRLPKANIPYNQYYSTQDYNEQPILQQEFYGYG